MARTAEVVHFPDGRDWRCPNRSEATSGAARIVEECGFSEPEDARPDDPSCPRCGTRLVRTTLATVTRPKAEARRF